MNQGEILLSTWLLFPFVAVLTTSGPASPQPTERILRVEVGTHNAGIMRAAMNPPNRLLVTGCEDKTVRVWNLSRRRELLRILRPPVDVGNEGKIHGVALSPEAGTVACGGITGSPQVGDGWVFLSPFPIATVAPTATPVFTATS
jgi:WD40 repeat protein